MHMIFRYKTKAVETLNLTIEESQPEQGGEYQPKLFNGEQRKLYRDDITPLTDEEKKALEASLSGIGCFLFLAIVTAAVVGILFLYYKDDFRTAYQCSSMVVAGALIVFFNLLARKRRYKKRIGSEQKKNSYRSGSAIRADIRGVV